jgi:carbon monoxide dehydrogenase subunit G
MIDPYVTDWEIDAPPALVWAAITETEQWPRWWRHVRRVEVVRRGDGTGLGAVRRIDWVTQLLYGFTIEVECTEVRPQRLLRGRARGALVGEGVWELQPSGAGTAVRYTWRAELAARWMRVAAPVLAPVFRWNHGCVMRSGEEGLRRLMQAAHAAGPTGTGGPRRH